MPRVVRNTPRVPDNVLLDELLDDSRDGKYLTTLDIAKARVRREATYGSAGLDIFHAEIAKVEAAVVLKVFEAKGSERGEGGVPLAVLREWLHDERLPEGWKPARTTGLWETLERSEELRKAMDEIRKSDGSTDC